MHGVGHTSHRRCIYHVLGVGRSHTVVDALQLVHVGRVAACVADSVPDHQSVGAGSAMFQAAVDVGQGQWR